MLGGTHKRIGIAVSFAILRPTTIPICLGTLAAGAIGGDICDIDILFKNHPAKDEDPDRDDHYDGAWEEAASNVLLFLLFVLVDWYFGNGAVDQMISELVWDVFCLMHSLDWALSSDTSMEVYEADVKYFKQKWFRPTNKDLARREIDAKAEELQEALATCRKELYETFQIEE